MKSLTVIEPKDLAEVQSVAQLFAQSGLFDDTKQTAQAFVKIMAGREIGLGAFAAMQNVYFVNGRPSYAANAIARGIKNNPKYDYRVLELTNDVCRIEFFENDQSVAIEELTMATVQSAGHDKNKNGSLKDNWQKFPRNMLFARTLTTGARFYCPDVFDVPVYVPDEMDTEPADEPMNYDPETGEIIEGDYTVSTDAVHLPVPPPTTPTDARNGTDTIDGTEFTKNAPERAVEPENAHSAPDDDFPTVGRLWSSVAKSLLDKNVPDLPDGVNVGAIVYPVATSRLGYADDDAVKTALELDSLKAFQGRFDVLLARIIDKSPLASAAQS